MKLTIPQLKELLKKEGLSVGGNKQQLIDRLKEADQPDQKTSEESKSNNDNKNSEDSGTDSTAETTDESENKNTNNNNNNGSKLTQDQLDRIEKNRNEVLARKEAKRKESEGRESIIDLLSIENNNRHRI